MGRTFDILSADRFNHNVKIVLEYDVDGWLYSPVGSTLDQFKFSVPETFVFTLTKTQYESLESALEQFGRDELSLGKVLIRISVNTLYRKGQLESTGRSLKDPVTIKPFEEISLAKNIRI